MKSPPSLSLADHRLLDLVWSSEPISSPQLCKLAQAQLGWKRTTTYTVIKRLCDKGCLKNEAAVVTSLVDRATVQQADGQRSCSAPSTALCPVSWPPFSGPAVSATRRPLKLSKCWRNTGSPIDTLSHSPRKEALLWTRSFPPF